MKRWKRARKLGGLVLAAVYLVLPGEVSGVRACPHHDAPADAARGHDADDVSGTDHGSRSDPASHADHTSHSDASHDDHASHRDDASHHDHASHAGSYGDCACDDGAADAAGADDHDGCACIGTCSPTGTVPEPALRTAPVVALPPAADDTHSVSHADERVPVRILPHLLPWSIGPPAHPDR